MKILKRITAIILATSILVLGGCDNKTVNSSGSTESSKSVSDLSSNTVSESSQQEERKNENTSTDADKNDFTALNKAVIQDMTRIDENTLLAIGQHNLVLVDTNTYKIFKEIPRTNNMSVQKIDNGFVTIDTRYESCSYDIYDTKGNITKHVDIPKRPLQGEELELGLPYTEIPTIETLKLRVSADGKNVFYFGDNGYCTNSIDLDNEIVIQPIENFNGGFEEFHKMSGAILYKDDIVYGTTTKFNPKINNNEFFFASMNLKTNEWMIYCQLNDDQQLFSHPSPFVDNSFIIVDAGADDRFTEGKLPYLILDENELKEFTCEEGLESVRAFISPNGKYILTTYTYTSEFGIPLDSEIKLYDVKTGEVLLKQKFTHHAQTAYIDENIRKLYVVCGTEFSVFDF